MTMSRGQFVAVTIVLAAAVMAGAGYLAYSAVSDASAPPRSPSSGDARTAAVSGSSPVIVPTTPGSAVASASASSSASADTAPPCQNGDITVSLGQTEGATGHISVLLLFANDSGHPCVLQGYPGAELTDPSGTLPPLDAARKLTGFMGGARGMSKPPRVSLAPGQTVSAVLEWSDVTASTSTASCYTGSAVLEATPPNTTQSTTLSLGGGALVCSGFQVHPVLPLIGSVPKA
jgi:hypothetical protein